MKMTRFLCVFLSMCFGVSTSLFYLGPSGKKEIPMDADYVDVIQWGRWEGEWGNDNFRKYTVALKADGTVEAEDLEYFFQPEEIEEILSWNNLKQIAGYGTGLAGLKNDGTVVFALMAGYEPKTWGDYEDSNIEQEIRSWENVSELIEGNYLYALTEDGRILVPGQLRGPIYQGAEYWDYTKWTDLKKAIWFGGSGFDYIHGLFGLCRDGTIQTQFNGPGEHISDYFDYCPENVAEIDCASSMFAGLKKDGTVFAFGEEAGGEDFQKSIRELRDVLQITAMYSHLAVRLPDGTVKVISQYSNDEMDAEIANWAGIIDIQTDRHSLFALSDKGQVYVFGNSTIVPVDKSTVSGWADVVKLKVRPGYILAWQSDGTILTAGIELPLNLSAKVATERTISE